MMKIILKDIERADWILGIRAAASLSDMFQKDLIMGYGENPTKYFYARRNKASITVRPTK